MAFLVELATLDGHARGQPAWRGLTIERNLNGGTLVGLAIDNDDQAAAEALIGDRTLRIWEDGVLRFHGKLREPLVATPGVLRLAAGSPYTLLDRRQLQTAKTFTQIDQGTIAKTILDAENARSPTRLRMGGYGASVKRDRTYEAGKSIQELIAELAAVEQGFYFVERPIVEAAAPTVFAELLLRWPDAGIDRPAVRFEYGEGTLGNVAGYTLTRVLPVNAVTYVGGAQTGAPPSRRAQNTASIARYDLLEQWYDDPDVTVPATLQEKADDRLRPDPEVYAELQLVASGPAVTAPPVAKLGHDFDVGDVVTVSIRDATIQEYGLQLRVTQATLTVSEEDDSEQLDVVLEDVDAIPAADEIERL